MNEQQSSGMALTFAGGLYDADTELIRFGARDYDSRIGRWTTKDPIGLAGGMNQYAYVSGNPMTYNDPSGLLFNGLIDAGESIAEDSVDYWAKISLDPNSTASERAIANVGGVFASLWTNDTSDDTFNALTLSGEAAAFRRLGFDVWIRSYPNAGGGGIGVNGFGKNKNLIRLDKHQFKENGATVNKWHIDIPGYKKHWRPWGKQ